MTRSRCSTHCSKRKIKKGERKNKKKKEEDTVTDRYCDFSLRNEKKESNISTVGTTIWETKRFTRPKYCAGHVSASANFVSIKSGIGGRGESIRLNTAGSNPRGSPFFKKPFPDRLSSLMALLFFFFLFLFLSPSLRSLRIYHREKLEISTLQISLNTSSLFFFSFFFKDSK